MTVHEYLKLLPIDALVNVKKSFGSVIYIDYVYALVYLDKLKEYKVLNVFKDNGTYFIKVDKE